jgi:hypothetical protein
MTEEQICEIRVRYRPLRVKVLCVGESPPANGRFFYCGNNDLLRHMRTAIGGPKDDAEFLNSFKERGWYLDDLVTAPIDNPRDIKKKCKDARSNLAGRIAEYKPSSIVCLMRRISDDVEIAACRSGSNAHLYVVPFAGNHHQNDFIDEMKRILLELDALP